MWNMYTNCSIYTTAVEHRICPNASYVDSKSPGPPVYTNSHLTLRPYGSTAACIRSVGADYNIIHRRGSVFSLKSQPGISSNKSPKYLIFCLKIVFGIFVLDMIVHLVISHAYSINTAAGEVNHVNQSGTSYFACTGRAHTYTHRQGSNWRGLGVHPPPSSPVHSIMTPPTL